MPKLELLSVKQVLGKATVTTTKTVTLKPSVARRLLNELRAYADLKAQSDAFLEALDAHKATIRELRESTGEGELELEGFKTKDVTGTFEKLNLQKFVALGGSLQMLQEATESKPKRSYELIVCPKAKTKTPADHTD